LYSIHPMVVPINNKTSDHQTDHLHRHVHFNMIPEIQLIRHDHTSSSHDKALLWYSVVRWRDTQNATTRQHIYCWYQSPLLLPTAGTTSNTNR